MKMMNKKAQSINEYAVVIGIVAIAIMSMRTYIKRGIQSIIQESADELSAPVQQFYNINPQKAAIAEIGLHEPDPNNPSSFVVNDDTVYTESNITLKESPPDGVNPVREAIINNYEIDVRKDFVKTSIIYGDGHNGSLNVLNE